MTEKVKVRVLKETTNWKYPNHTYFLDASSKRLIAYIKEGTDELVRFKGKGLPFYRSGRTFDVKWRYI